MGKYLGQGSRGCSAGFRPEFRNGGSVPASGGVTALTLPGTVSPGRPPGPLRLPARSRVPGGFSRARIKPGRGFLSSVPLGRVGVSPLSLSLSPVGMVSPVGTWFPVTLPEREKREKERDRREGLRAVSGSGSVRGSPGGVSPGRGLMEYGPRKVPERSEVGG